MNNNYDGNSIQVLEGLEAVRHRPGMYIGATSEKGLHHLVWEIVDNAVDEALAGFCNKIDISILEGNVIEVKDNGRGIPVGINEKQGKSALELVFTVLHAGGKFNSSTYKTSGGLHGVGASVTNALSEYTDVYVSRDGKIYNQRYEQGRRISELKVVGKSKENGTIVRFKPDPEIFTETTEFKYKILERRLKELAYLNSGLEITLSDLRVEDGKKDIFKFDGGISDFLLDIEKGNKKLMKNPIFISGESNNVVAEIALTYNTGYSENINSYVNNINTHEGGTHVSGFKTALTRVVNDIALKMGFLKSKDAKFQGSDIREGVSAIVSVKVPEPEFEGQTKTKLGNSEVSGVTSSIVGQFLKIYLEDHPDEAKVIIEKILVSKKAREAAKRAREAVMRKSVLEVGSLPGKLSDCSSKKADDCEIYIVEGDSAGGSAKQGRDRSFQAILPLRGKIINVEKAGLSKALENTEIMAMITAFGTNIGDDFNLDKLRYGKIIIMTDADVDGAHIRTLMLTFFYRHMRELIDNGHIYIAQPPLFKISSGRKTVQYAYSDRQLKEMTNNLDKKNTKYTLQRYKGLGEMDPAQLWETTMDPDTRGLLRVTLDDGVRANEIFSTLMGDQVSPRRKFIEDNSQFATIDM